MELKEKKAKDLLTDKIFTLSNFLSIVRVILLPFFVLESIRYHETPSDHTILIRILIICIVAILTDYFDGFIARLLHQESVVGRYLDPICDKFTTIGGLGVLVYLFQYPIWVFVFYIFRELLGVWLGGYLYLKRGIQGKPNLWGKLGVCIVSLSVVWYFLLPFWGTTTVLEQYPILKQPELSSYLLFVVLIFGMIQYTFRYWNIILHPNSPKIDLTALKNKKKFDVL